jgi:hypothetical protein
MTSISPKNFPPPSTAIPKPATGGDKSVKQVKAGLTKPSGGHPAMPELISMKARPESGIAKSHAIRSQTDIGALPSAAGLLDASMLRDVAIRKRNADQYDDVISRIGALHPSLRADELEALARKSNFSGKDAVRTFFDLADILQGASPDSRGKALRTMVDLIPTLEVKNIPLVGDQERAHDALLTMTQAMSPALQREVLRALIDSRAPDTSRAKAQAALTALG